MAHRKALDTERFQRIKEPGRWYRDVQTGERVSYRRAREASIGMKLETFAARRAESRPTPALDRLRDRIESMTRRGFGADEIAHRTRTAERSTGRVSRIIGPPGKKSHELISPRTVRDISRGKSAVSERRAEQVLRTLDNPSINYNASVIGRDGSVVRFELVGEDSVHKFYTYYDAIVKLSKGDSSKFDSLKGDDFNIRIVGPSGRVEDYRLNDNKRQIQDELSKGRIEDYELPDQETKRGRS